MRSHLFVLALLATAAAAEPPIRHAFLAADPRAGRVALVNEAGVIGWTCAAKDVCDATVLTDGRVLLSDRGGARIVTRAGQVVWDYRAPKEAEVYTCQMLPGGKVLVCEGGTKRLANGNTIICNWPGHGHEGKQPMLVEITREKQVVWQFDGRDRFRGIIGFQLQ